MPSFLKIRKRYKFKLSVQAYEIFVRRAADRRASDPLAPLQARFEDMLTKMKSPAMGEAIRELFGEVNTPGEPVFDRNRLDDDAG